MREKNFRQIKSIPSDAYHFISIDFETANNYLTSACALGLVVVKENAIVGQEYHLIRPPTLNFNPYNIRIHGITEEMVRNSPLFSEIWDNIKGLFQGNHILVAHNAQFDMNVLMNCLNHYELEIPDFSYTCSIPISSIACSKKGIRASLTARASHFGIDIIEHHNALSDAITCALIVIESINRKNQENLAAYCSTYPSIPIHAFKNLKVKKTFWELSRFGKVSIKDITATTDKFNEEHLFFGKNIVLTGELESMSRRTAMQTIVDLGGVNKSSVSRKTDFLIVGAQDSKVVGKNGISTKERKAYELIEKGYGIKILSEAEFLKHLQWRDC
ncbi:MAG TPA: exonuclease domain-containing protein [Syntrophomonadaceae bacterium]|nr:exonuclease domain-containing protein [Syntrophomonadaceae bacterium]